MKRIIIRHLSGFQANQVASFSSFGRRSIYFGRDPSCDVRFDAEKDDVVSRSHAVLEWDDDRPDGLRFSDLLSSNGTFLDGNRVTEPVSITSGSKLQLGKLGPTLELVIEDMSDSEIVDAKQAADDTLRVTRQVSALKGEFAP